MAKKPVKTVSADHPRWSVLDSSSARYLLVDIGMDREVDDDGNVHNGGFGDWDGMIYHFNTRFDKESITLLHQPGWSEEQVVKTMDSYILTFQTLNTKDSLENYDFEEVIVTEIVAWPPVPSGQIREEEPEEPKKEE
tara:strand:+ start:3394 stop:3804 length:411 start_codon:yes stop_codon:yes gene_type:complete